MPEPLTIAAVIVVLVLGFLAMAYSAGRTTGLRQGYERAAKEVSIQVGPYQHVRRSLFGAQSVEAGFTLTVCKNGKPVIAPIDAIVIEERKVSRQRLAEIGVAALGAASATVEIARRGGVTATLVSPPK